MSRGAEIRKGINILARVIGSDHGKEIGLLLHKVAAESRLALGDSKGRR